MDVFVHFYYLVNVFIPLLYFLFQINGVTGQTYSFDGVKDAIWRVSSALSRHGFSKGDVLMMVSLNCPEYLIMVHAAMCLGGIVTFANPAGTLGQCLKYNKCGTPVVDVDVCVLLDSKLSKLLFWITLHVFRNYIEYKKYFPNGIFCNMFFCIIFLGINYCYNVHDVYVHVLQLYN